MFYGCYKLKEIKGINKFTTHWVFDMKAMFEKCFELTYLDLSNFNTLHVFGMGFMFNKCHKLKEIKGINKFKTSNVIDMKSMFGECNELKYLDLSNFNTANVTDMNSMFAECFELDYLNITNFNTSNVIDMAFMFNKCYKLKEIKGINKFNTIKVINFDSMFEDCYNSENYKKYIPQLNINKKSTKILSVKKKLIKVNFCSVDQQIDKSIECYNLDIFSIIEQKLFLSYPELKQATIIYLFNGAVITDKSLTLEELKIRDDAHILLDYLKS